MKEFLQISKKKINFFLSLSPSFSAEEPEGVGGMVQPLQDQLGPPTVTHYGLQGGLPAAVW